LYFSVDSLRASTIEVCVVLLVGETGDTQDASRIGRGGIAAEFICHGAQETFGFLEVHALNFPNNLMLFRRTIQYIVGRGDDAEVFDSF